MTGTRIMRIGRMNADRIRVGFDAREEDAGQDNAPG